jgi:hypothetical protein
MPVTASPDSGNSHLHPKPSKFLLSAFTLCSQSFPTMAHKSGKVLLAKKEIEMNRSIVYRIIAGIVLLLALAGIAYFAYQAGVSQAQVSELSGATGKLPEGTTWYGLGYAGRGLFFGPFFLLRCLVGLFLLGLAFSALRLLLWGPRWRMHHFGMWGYPRYWKHHGSWGEWKEGQGPQSMFDEWHRKAHESDEEPKS